MCTIAIFSLLGYCCRRSHCHHRCCCQLFVIVVSFFFFLFFFFFKLEFYVDHSIWEHTERDATHQWMWFLISVRECAHFYNIYISQQVQRVNWPTQKTGLNVSNIKKSTLKTHINSVIFVPELGRRCSFSFLIYQIDKSTMIVWRYYANQSLIILTAYFDDEKNCGEEKVKEISSKLPINILLIRTHIH